MSDVDGRWNLEIETIRGKQKTATLDLSTDGETVSGALIGERMTLEFDSGRRKGNAIRLEVRRVDSHVSRQADADLHLHGRRRHHQRHDRRPQAEAGDVQGLALGVAFALRVA